MEAARHSAFLKDMETRFKPFTDELNARLNNWKFDFPEQKTAHLLHLDPELVVRHALPYCISEETYFTLGERDVKFFSAVILLHSLALTRIDDYYDGGHQSRQGKLTVENLAYSLSATHNAILTLLQCAPDMEQLRRLLKVSTFVHARMYKDYTERYRLENLDHPERRIQMYLHSPQSRLLGSGYWEVMARASFAQRGKSFPAYLHNIDLNLRRFRQIIDELNDVEEDLRGGLITLPILYASTKKPQAVRRLVEHYWDLAPHDQALSLDEVIDSSGVKQWIHERAMKFYSAGINELEAKLGRRGDGYRRLFDYKRVKLEWLTGQNAVVA